MPYGEAFRRPSVQQMQSSPAKDADNYRLDSILSSTRKHNSIPNDIVATHLCYQC